jgi:hypothetical protein
VPSTIRVTGSDRAVRERLQEWLDRTELTPPGALGVDLESGPVPKAPDSPPIFEQPEIAIHRTADGGVAIRWLTAPAHAEIPRGSGQACVWIGDEAQARLEPCCHYLMSMVLIFLLRRAGWHHLHATSAIDPRGRGWLLAGNTQAGKSTTAALLASRGWAVGNDDMVFLTRDEAGDVVAVARRNAIALRTGGRALLGRLGGRFDERRQKTLFTPEELGGSWAPRVRPDILLFISVGDTETTLQPISPGEVLSQLVRWSASVILEHDLAQSHLDLLAGLGGQTRCYRASLGPDLFTNPDLLMDLVP